MKNIFLLLLWVFVAASCTKEKTEISDTVVQDTISMVADSTMIADSATQQISGIEVLDLSPEQGRAIFKSGDETLFYFDHNSQQGQIVVENKTYKLTRMDFTDNQYKLTGAGIEIIANHGEFSDSAGDCLYGNFREATIRIGSESRSVPSIQVQDCPVY